MSTPEEQRQKRIKNQLAEEGWKQDRLEWRNWMKTMRGKFAKMHATPQDRVNYENRNRR